MDSLAGVAPVENCGMASAAQATTSVPIRANFFTVTLLWGCGSWPNRTGPFSKTLDEAMRFPSFGHCRDIVVRLSGRVPVSSLVDEMQRDLGTEVRDPGPSPVGSLAWLSLLPWILRRRQVEAARR